jgi:hypothetical protein
MRVPLPIVLLAVAVPNLVVSAHGETAVPELSLEFRLSRSDLKCLVDTSKSLLEHPDPIVFSPDVCVSQASLDALLSGSKRTSLPNWKMSLPNSRRASGPSDGLTPPRYVFTHKTLGCLVNRSRLRALPDGDPVHIDLRNCP